MNLRVPLNLRHSILFILVAAMTVYNFVAPDAALFRTPSLTRIIFWHLPCALLATWFLFHSAFLGARYLMTRDLKYDCRLGSSIEMGAVMGGLTMVTGILFSWAQWGVWWQWDPRQTSFLMVLFLFILGVVLREGFSDDQKRAAVSSSYSLLTLLPSLFLTFVFPRLEQVKRDSLHPSQTIQNNFMDTNYKIGVYGTLAVLAWVVAEILIARNKVKILELKLDQNNGYNKIGSSSSTPTGVVRPVALHEKD